MNVFAVIPPLPNMSYGTNITKEHGLFCLE
jgi:hypothetical protein